jgi:hypothetical protein
MSGGIIPGIHDEAHALAFFAGRDRFLAAGGPRRCSAFAKHGGKCGGWALRGCPYCVLHAPNEVRRARRLLLLSRPLTAKQAARALRREQARLQRIAWKKDRWRDGATVALGAREEAFQADILGRGFNPVAFSPATADAARWCWINVQAGRMTLPQFCDRVRWNVLKD